MTETLYKIFDNSAEIQLNWVPGGRLAVDGDGVGGGGPAVRAATAPGGRRPLEGAHHGLGRTGRRAGTTKLSGCWIRLISLRCSSLQIEVLY